MFKWRRINVALTLVLACTTLGADVLFSQGRQPRGQRRTAIVEGREVVEGEVIVRYRSETGRVERDRAEFQVESEVSEAIGRRGARRVRSARLSTRQMLAALRDNPDVEFVEPNFIIRASAAANDPSGGSLWGLFNNGQNVNGQVGIAGADIDANAAWDIAKGSRANIVAVIDSGIDFNHADLAANVFTAPRAFSVTVGGITVNCAAGTHGYNALNNSCVPFDDNGHGTHVAGIIGAVGNNGIGVTGVSWTANIMALKVLGVDGTGTTADAIKGIEFAIKAKAALGADANVRVLNASWGDANFSQALNAEIDAAYVADMLFVASAGSNASNNDVVPHYPASATGANVVSVAATNSRDELAAHSNFGATSVHLAAPGDAILSTVPNNGYGFLSGTSMAAPYVSGAAALVLSSCQLNTFNLKANLLNNVDRLATLTGKTSTGGRLNAYSSLLACTPGTATLTVSNTTVAPGANIQAVITNDRPKTGDWVALYPLGASDTAFLDWTYLNGTKTLPTAATGNVTISIPAPSTPGTYQLRLFMNSGYTRLATSSDVNVGLQPSLSISDATVTEGNSGAATATFTVTLNRASTQTVTVNYATANGTATAGSDYTATSGTLNFAPSTLSRQITVAVSGDTTPEPTETFFVNLSSPLNGTIADGQGVGSITSDELPPPPSLTVTTPTVAPGGTLEIAVANGPGLPRDWLGLYVPSAADGTFVDFVYLNGLKTVPAVGQSSGVVQFNAPAVAGTYEVRLFTDGGYTRLATANVTVAVATALSIGDATVTEGNSGTVAATFTVTLSRASSQTVTVAYTTANGSATAGSDFVAASGTLTFAPSTLTQSISVTVNGDIAVEPSETFTITLSNAANAVIGDGTGLGTILTDDGSLSPSVSGPATAVAPGSVFDILVNNATGARDWVALYVPGAADGAFLDWAYLNGQKTAPTAGPAASVTVRLPAPTVSGTYELRLFANGGYARLGTATITVGSVPPSSGASLTVNTPTVAPGGTIQIVVANGPGLPRDWLGLYVPSAADVALVDFVYLNGLKTVPAVGQSSAVVQFPAPTVAGTYEVRFFTNGGYTKLATSASITVASVPTLSINDVTITEGNSATALATFTVTLSSASAQTVTVAYATANGSATAGSDFAAASGTLTFAPSTLTQSISVTVSGDTAAEPSETFTVTLSNPTNAAIGDGTGLGTILTDDGSPSPSLSGPATAVAPGSLVDILVNNATGARDWVALYVPGAADGAFLDWAYLNGQKTAPTAGPAASVTVRLPAPTVSGTYELRLFSNGGYTRLATATITVGSVPSSSGASLTVNTPTVIRGGTIQIVVAGGPGLPRDWLGVYVPSAADGTFVDFVYLNGLKTVPAAGQSSAVVQFPAPTVAGTYEVRLFTNGGYTKLATSTSIVVTP